MPGQTNLGSAEQPRLSGSCSLEFETLGVCQWPRNVYNVGLL